MNWTHSIPTLSPNFSHQSAIHLFLKKLMCLFVYFLMAFGHLKLKIIWVCHHQHQHTFLHLCSLQRYKNKTFSCSSWHLSEHNKGWLDNCQIWSAIVLNTFETILTTIVMPLLFLPHYRDTHSWSQDYNQQTIIRQTMTIVSWLIGRLNKNAHHKNLSKFF